MLFSWAESAMFRHFINKQKKKRSLRNLDYVTSVSVSLTNKQTNKQTNNPNFPLCYFHSVLFAFLPLRNLLDIGLVDVV